MPGLPSTASARPLLQADLPECLFHADLGKFNWELIFVTKKILLMFCAQLQLQKLEVWMRENTALLYSIRELVLISDLFLSHIRVKTSFSAWNNSNIASHPTSYLLTLNTLYNCSINTLYSCSMSCMSQWWLTTVAPEFAWLVALYKYDTNTQPRPAARHTVRSAGFYLYRPLTARTARVRLHGPRVVRVLVCNYSGACFWSPPPDTCLPRPSSALLPAAISANEGWIIRTINLSSGLLPRLLSLLSALHFWGMSPPPLGVTNISNCLFEQNFWVPSDYHQHH